MSTRNYKLFSDSTCDLPEDIQKITGVEFIKLKFELEGAFHDDGGVPYNEFYEELRKGASAKTTQITPVQCVKYFERALLDGYDVLYLGFSSGLSGSFNSACAARDELKERYPEAKIICVDSLCASTGEGLLLYKAWQKKQEGMSIDELAKWLEDNKLHLCHMFTVDDLKFLHRGGRISKATAVAGSILGIKPLLHVDDEGHLIALGKTRGRKQSLAKLVDMMMERVGDWENPVIAICHGDCIEDAEYVKKLALEKLGKKTETIISYTGTVIGAHSGPGTVALFFMGDRR